MLQDVSQEGIAKVLTGVNPAGPKWKRWQVHTISVGYHSTCHCPDCTLENFYTLLSLSVIGQYN